MSTATFTASSFASCAYTRQTTCCSQTATATYSITQNQNCRRGWNSLTQMQCTDGSSMVAARHNTISLACNMYYTAVSISKQLGLAQQSGQVRKQTCTKLRKQTCTKVSHQNPADLYFLALLSHASRQHNLESVTQPLSCSCRWCSYMCCTGSSHWLRSMMRSGLPIQVIKLPIRWTRLPIWTDGVPMGLYIMPIGRGRWILLLTGGCQVLRGALQCHPQVCQPVSLQDISMLQSFTLMQVHQNAVRK